MPPDALQKPIKTGRPGALFAAIDLTLICAGFITLIYLNREWLLDRLGGIDQWAYTGYFLHYDVPSVLANNKKLARLPWILSGFSLNRLLPPIAAAHVLHGSYFLLSCTGVYLAIRKLLDQNIALLTALFCLFYAELYGPGGWDYHDVAGGVFYLFCYIGFAVAAENQMRPLLRFFAAGILLALTIHTNIVSVNLIPVFVIEVVAVLKRRGFVFSQNKRWLVAGGVGVLIGAATCTILLGLINLGVGRDFLFFSNLLIRSEELILDPRLQQDWWQGWGSLWWVKQEIQMALYIGVLVPASVLLVHSVLKRRRLWTDVTSVLFIEYIGAFAIMLGWQMAGQTSLTPSYMAYPLTFPAIFALAALISRVLRASDPPARAASWFCGIAFAAYVIYGDAIEHLIVTPLASVAFSLFGRDDLDALLPFVVFTCGFAVVGSVAIALRHAIGMRRSAYVALFSCVTFVLAITDKEFANLKSVDFQNRCVIRQPVYAAIVETNRYLFHETNSKYQINLWFRPNELIGITNCRVPVHAWTIGQPLIFSGIGAIMPWDEMVSSIADLPIETLKGLNPLADVAAVISRTSTPAVELANELTKTSGGTWRILRTKTLKQGPIQFTISIVGASQDAIVDDQSL
jgi:hypothetical protein